MIASSQSTTSPNFSQQYCRQHNISEYAFVSTLLLKTMHAPLRWILPLLFNFNSKYLECDIELLTFCAQHTNQRGLEHELREFSNDIRNRGFLRGKLRQRVSTQILRRVYRATLADRK